MPTNRRKSTEQDLANEVRAKIQSYEDQGFSEASKIHRIILDANPSLCPRLWYGMPGYAKSKDGAVLCSFRKDKHITFGVTESVDLETFAKEDRPLIPAAWFVVRLDKESEAKIRELVEQATG